MEKVDLHIHSVYSDSDQSLEDIFTQAKKKGLKAVAITDHDTVEAFPEAYEVSKRYGIELIEGIEVSAEHHGIEVHVLGYLFNIEDRKFLDAVAEVRKVRKERLIKMAQNLNILGNEFKLDELEERLNVGIATRLHLAQYMLEKNQVSSIWEAFTKYLSPGKPAYVNRFRFSVEETIQMIHNAGGVAVLAHPHYLSHKEGMKEFVEYGLNGLEVVYPRFSSVLISYYKKLAERLHLFKTGGSDAHGSYKEFTSVGEIAVPYSWVEEMKNVRRSLFSKKNI